MRVSIDILGPDDWELWKTKRAEAVQTDPRSFGSTYEEDMAHDEQTWRARLEKSPHYAARVDDSVVGIVCAVPEDGEKLQHIVNIYSMYVEPKVRGQGIGRALMERVIKDQMDREQTVKLKLHAVNTDTAVRLYESVGFSKVALLKKENFVNGEYLDEWLMEKFVR